MENKDNSLDGIRRKRCQIEWMPVLKANEYVLLDKMLFQSNLTQANLGKGYIFHIRQLAKETGIARTTISSICQTWPFLKKEGYKKAMQISFDYPAFDKWIVRLMDNNSMIVRHMDNVCPPNGPISKKEEVTLQEHDVASNEAEEYNKSLNDSLLSNDSPTNDIIDTQTKELVAGPSEARIEASEAKTIDNLNVGDASTDKRIVRLMDKDKSGRFIATNPTAMKLPKQIKDIPSKIRQQAIVEKLNDGGFRFRINGKKCSEKDGYKFCAYDCDMPAILITGDSTDYLDNPKIQSLCRHFDAKQCHILLWTSKDSSYFVVEAEK